MPVPKPMTIGQLEELRIGCNVNGADLTASTAVWLATLDAHLEDYHRLYEERNTEIKRCRTAEQALKAAQMRIAALEHELRQKET